MPIDRARYWTIEEFAELQLVTRRTVRRWIKRGRLVHADENGEPLIDREANTAFFRDDMPNWHRRQARSWEPREIQQFRNWHEVIDSLTWLLKISYSNPRDIQRKAFRADALFSNYIESSRVLSLPSLARALDAGASRRRRQVTDDLKRGWYNELAYQFPPRPSSLSMSFRDIELNKVASSSRMAFPSWRITQAYYSSYFFVRAISLQKTGAFRLEEHNATISTFRNSVQKPLERLILKFPLSIMYEPGVRVHRSKLPVAKLPHMRFAYAKHPRHGLAPRDVFDEILSTFRNASRRRKNPGSYGLLDFLRDFRVWANYQNIDDLLNLYGAGYKAFLDQNLSLLLFFLGGISELSYMACFTSAAYVKEIQNLYDLFASNNDDLKRGFPSSPLMQRLAIYRELGLVTEDVVIRHDVDVNSVKLNRVEAAFGQRWVTRL